MLLSAIVKSNLLVNTIYVVPVRCVSYICYSPQLINHVPFFAKYSTFIIYFFAIFSTSSRITAMYFYFDLSNFAEENEADNTRVLQYVRTITS